jgi:hypothetical protein
VIEGLGIWIEAFMGGPAEIDVLKAFLEHGVDPNIQCTASTFGWRGRRPLRILEGDLETPWTLLLNWRLQKYYGSLWEETAFELFLKTGASTPARFRPPSYSTRADEYKPVPEILEALLPGDKFKAVRSEYILPAERR